MKASKYYRRECNIAKERRKDCRGGYERRTSVLCLTCILHPRFYTQRHTYHELSKGVGCRHLWNTIKCLNTTAIVNLHGVDNEISTQTCAYPPFFASRLLSLFQIINPFDENLVFVVSNAPFPPNLVVVLPLARTLCYTAKLIAYPLFVIFRKQWWLGIFVCKVQIFVFDNTAV